MLDSKNVNKVCIWCKEQEPKVTFKRPAHIFPQSLGGQRICKNVCDKCNTYFGSKESMLPSVEIALKEPLNISRIFLLSRLNKANQIPRFKSEYFDYDFKNHIISPKQKYRTDKNFQSKFVKQFKRGVYKIFLEERDESMGDALHKKFDFIRDFARHGKGDYPVLYCRPKMPAVFASHEDIKNPVIRFTDYSEGIMQEYGFYSYFFLTHTIAIPVIKTFELTFTNYINLLLKENSIYDRITPLQNITDLDFIFSFAFDK